MARTVTVTFDDGTSHVYQNVPDEITPDQITSRASSEFGGKTITNIDGGRNAPSNAEVSLAPQGVAVARQLGAIAPDALETGAQLAKQGLAKGIEVAGNRGAVQTAADIAGIVSHGVPWGTIGKQVLDPESLARQALGGNGATLRDVASGAVNAVKQGSGMLASGARNLGGALVQGALAPESLMMLPYQAAAYEQEKIRANPNAPEYANNPYAQSYRGEYATPGQAGAANARRAVINTPFGNVTPEERAILEKDRQDRLKLMMQYEAARKVLGQQ